MWHSSHLSQESYVWEMYQERSWEFFPVGDCFRKQYEDQLGWWECRRFNYLECATSLIPTSPLCIHTLEADPVTPERRNTCCFYYIYLCLLSYNSSTSCSLDGSVPINRPSQLFETLLHLCRCPAHFSGPLPPSSVAFCLLLQHLNIDEILGPLLFATGCLWGILRYNSVMVAWQEGTCRMEQAIHWCKHGPKRTLLLICLPPAFCLF